MTLFYTFLSYFKLLFFYRCEYFSHTSSILNVSYFLIKHCLDNFWTQTQRACACVGVGVCRCVGVCVGVGVCRCVWVCVCRCVGV